MKKRLVWMSTVLLCTFVLMLFASCSSDDDSPTLPDTPVEPAEEGYMGVKNPRQTAIGTKDNEVTWSCIEFGAYPANEVVSGQFDAVDGYAVREGCNKDSIGETSW